MAKIIFLYTKVVLRRLKRKEVTAKLFMNPVLDSNATLLSAKLVSGLFMKMCVQLYILHVEFGGSKVVCFLLIYNICS